MVACAPTLSVYDDAQFECLEQQPQHKGAEIAAALRSEAALAVDAEIQARRTCLALARVQRTVHPLQYPFSPSGPLALASAHMDLADAYRAARLHAQVKEHAALALDELQSALVQRPPQLRVPPADFGAHLSRAQRHEALAEHTRRHSAACVRAHKLLAETCMETRPPDVQGALAAFSRALPDLPRLGEPSGGGALPAQVAAELLRDAPFATLLASCYGHVASGVLAQAESLQADNAALRDDVAANLAETVDNEGRIDPEAVTTADEVEAAKRAAVVQAAPPARARPVQLTPRELADAMLAVEAMRLPQLAEAEAPRASLRIAETRRLGGRTPSRRQSLAVTANTMKLEEAAMPKRGSLAWLLLPPHQKLEQLCMWLAAARAQRASALVVMATPSCAQYAVSLLEALQEEELFHFPRMSAVLCGRSPGARTQVVHEQLERVLSVKGAAFCDFAAAQSADASKWDHVLIFDAPRPCDAAKLLAHCCKAPATLLLMPSEALMLPFLQRQVRKMAAEQAAALPLQYADADDDTMPLDAVMRRRCFKTVALQSLGCKALADFVSWYAHSGHPWAMPATALHGETLRTLFLVPTVNDAVSSMAHSFRVHTQSVAESDAGALQLAMSLGPDAEAAVTTSRNIPAPEDHVRPALLDGAVAALEALDAWQEVRQRRRELDAARDALLQRRAGVEAALRKLPPQIQEALDRATELLHAVATTLEPAAVGVDHLSAVLGKVWQRVSEAQYLCGCTHLHDLDSERPQRFKACAAQLSQIMASKRAHPHLCTLAPRLEAKALRRLGECHLELGHPDAAIEAFEELLRAEEAQRGKQRMRRLQRGQAHKLLGDALGKAKRYASAEEHHARAWKLYAQHWKGQDPDGSVQELEQCMQDLLHAREQQQAQ